MFLKEPDPLFFPELDISQYVSDSDAVISLAKMKTNNICNVSLSIKNLKGILTIPWKKKFHCEGLNMGIVDFFNLVRPKLSIIDATYVQDLGKREIKAHRAYYN